jgi:UDP-3-O-[3-hydroxymyristoyl] N-acetylglucosamine deacetylase/3-hydroxyacyl-[acyl-carrier-protein] dehydratase
VKLLLMPAKSYQVTTMVDFGTKVLGHSKRYNAPCRLPISKPKSASSQERLAFLHELEMLLEHGSDQGR